MDDTLYDEMTFVRSGFRAVAHHLHDSIGAPRQQSYEWMLKKLEADGRGSVFDDVLARYGNVTRAAVARCVRAYRLHQPELSLNPDAERCLQRFAAHGQYVVTDGHKLVQRNKANALGLFERMNKVFITYRHGRSRSKPSPYCFQLIAGLESASPRDIVYVGDNPHKDFVGIKPLGFRTIRIRAGAFRDLVLDESHEAHETVDSLDEITPSLLRRLQRAD